MPALPSTTKGGWRCRWRRSALPLLFRQWLSLIEPSEEQFVAECENDRTDEQTDDPEREKPTDRPKENDDHGRLDPAAKQDRLEDIVDQPNEQAPDQKDGGDDRVGGGEHVDHGRNQNN